MFILFPRNSLLMLLTGKILRVLPGTTVNKPPVCFNCCLYLTVGGTGFRRGGDFPAGGVTDALRVSLGLRIQKCGPTRGLSKINFVFALPPTLGPEAPVISPRMDPDRLWARGAPGFNRLQIILCALLGLFYYFREFYAEMC